MIIIVPLFLFGNARPEALATAWCVRASTLDAPYLCQSWPRAVFGNASFRVRSEHLKQSLFLSLLLLFRGLIVLMRSFRQRADNTEHVAERPETRGIAVEKLLDGEFAIERLIAVAGEIVGHRRQQIDVGLFQDRVRGFAIVGEIGLFVFITAKDRSPACHRFRRFGASEAQLLALQRQYLGEAISLQLQHLVEELSNCIAVDR